MAALFTCHMTNIDLTTTVSPEIDRALASLVELTGVSKATVVRYSILQMLSGIGLVFPEAVDSLKPTKTEAVSRPSQ